MITEPEEVRKILRHLVKIDISFVRSREALHLKAGRNEIRQVILNLLKNSFDAMPGGGEVTISTRSRTDGHGRNGRYVEITVQDTGTGIPKENVSDVFLPFFTTKSTQKHMGLGLSISYGIVRKYNGEISVTNLRDGGCRFRIALPLQFP